MKRTYIIAEIGINFAYGDSTMLFLDNIKKLIDVAAFAGCDAVKFQKRNPDQSVPELEKSKPKMVPWKAHSITYLQYKWDIELNKAQYDEIDQYCKQKNIQWSASVWDLDSINFISAYNLPWIKIPSALITNTALIEKCCQYYNKVIISTGMSEQQEIDAAANILYKHRNRITPIIMHCVSSYPVQPQELNLSYLQALKEQYPWATIGYSGHEIGLTTTMASIYLGAEYIERHITLDHGLWGTDQSSSVEPQGIIKLVKGVRDLEKAYGSGIKQLTAGEIEKRRSLRG